MDAKFTELVDSIDPKEAQLFVNEYTKLVIAEGEAVRAYVDEVFRLVDVSLVRDPPPGCEVSVMYRTPSSPPTYYDKLVRGSYYEVEHDDKYNPIAERLISKDGTVGKWKVLGNMQPPAGKDLIPNTIEKYKANPFETLPILFPKSEDV